MPGKRLATAFSLALLLATPAGAQSLPVGIAAQSMLFIPLDVGLANGAYAKQGLQVQKLDFSGAGKLNQGMIAGSADIGLTGSTDFSFQVKGAPSKTVAAIVTSPADLGLSVGNSITSIADMKGKRIGVTQPGTLTWWLAQEFARSQGWGDNGVIPVSVGGHNADQVAAILTGQIAGVMSHVELGLELAEQHRGRVLLNASQFVPGFMSNSIIASNALIAHQPEALRRFLAAWFQSVAWMTTHEDGTIQIASQTLGVQPDVLRQEWPATSASFSRDGRITPQQLDQIADAIASIGLVTGKPDLTPYYDPSFLPGAEKRAAR
jgi:NitT/TauT family transport system substrate-binding protein